MPNKNFKYPKTKPKTCPTNHHCPSSGNNSLRVSGLNLHMPLQFSYSWFTFIALDSENPYSTSPLTDSGARGHSCPNLFLSEPFHKARERVSSDGNVWAKPYSPNASWSFWIWSVWIGRSEETQHLMWGTNCGQYCCHPVWLGNGQPFVTVEGV